MMSSKTLKFNIFLIVMALAGFSIWIYSADQYMNLDYLGITFFFLLHILSEVFAVELPKGGMVSFGFAVDIAAIIVFGPFVAVLLSLGGIIGSLFNSEISLRKALLNILLFTITISVSGVAYYQSGGGHNHLTLIRDVIPLIIASVTYLLVNASFLTCGISIIHDLNFKATWQSNIKWALPSFVALAPLGYLLAYVYESMSIPGALLLLIPLFLARFSFNQYIQTKKAHLSVVQALAAALEAKDPYTRGHSDRVAEYSEAICRRLGMSEEFIEELVQAARMHDIGKIGVPEEILNKPGQLTDLEFGLIKGHPQAGFNILKEVDFLTSIAEIIRYHHEWYDGSKGYPGELSGEKIPIGARILMVADCFDAMTSDRPYRKALTVEEAIMELKKGGGSQFDPRIVETFVGYIYEKEQFSTDVGFGLDRDSIRLA